jgi:hypothetical protein
MLTYTENNTLEFSSYLQNNSWTKKSLLRLKVGLQQINMMFTQKMIKLTAITPIRIGDNRTKLNNQPTSSAF